MREFLVPELQKRYLPQLEHLFTIMLDLSEEGLRNVKKEDIEEIVRHLEAIIREYAGADTYEKTERFALAFARKCFSSTNLEKRLHGLAYIDEAISMTQRRKHYQPWDDYGYSSSTYRMPQVARYGRPFLYACPLSQILLFFFRLMNGWGLQVDGRQITSHMDSRKSHNRASLPVQAFRHAS